MKIKYILFSLFCLMSTIVWSQETQETRKTQYGVALNPQLSTLLMNLDLERIESPWKFSYGFSLNAIFALNASHHLQAGLGLQTSRFAFVDYAVFFGCDANGNGGVNQEASYIEESVSIHYLSIPFSYLYNFSKTENHLYTRIGGNILTRLGATGESQVYECGSPTSSSSKYSISNNRFVLLGTFGLGYQFKIHDTYLMYLEPNVAVSLTDHINQQENLISRNAAGLFLGMIVGVKF